MPDIDLQTSEQEFHVEIQVENADDYPATGGVSFNFGKPTSETIGYNGDLFEQQLEGGESGRLLIDIGVPYGTQEQTYALQSARIGSDSIRLNQQASLAANIEKLSEYGIDYRDYQFTLTNPKPISEADKPRFQNVLLDTRAVDLASGAQAIALSFEADDASGLRYASFGFRAKEYNGYGNGTRRYLNFSIGGNPVTGDAKDGYWVGVATLPSTSENGEWELDSFSVYDTLDNQYYTSRDTDSEYDDGNETYRYTLSPWDAASLATLQSLGLDISRLSFSVSNGVEATPSSGQAPRVDGLEFGLNSIDLSDKIQSKPVFVEALISDSDYLSNHRLTLSNSSDDNSGKIELSFNRDTLVSGYLANGRHIAISEAFGQITPGTWVLTGLSADGTNSIYREWSGTGESRALSEWSEQEVETLTSLGIDPAELEINISGELRQSTVQFGDPVFHTHDLTPVSWAEIDLSEGNQDLEFEVSIREPESSIGRRNDSEEAISLNLASYGSINWEGPDGSRISTIINSSELIEVENGISTYRLRVPVNQDITAGLWTMNWLDLTNNKGQRRSFSPIERREGEASVVSQANIYEDIYGIAAGTFGFIITNSEYDPATADREAPRILSAQLSNTTNTIGGNEQAYLEITVSDVGAGFGTMQSQINSATLENSNLQDYLNRAGTFRLTNRDGSTISMRSMPRTK